MHTSKLCWVLAVSLGLAIGGCTPPAPSPEQEEAVDSDPLETYNRAMYRFNYTLDMLVLKPVTKGYQAVVPRKGRTMVSNFIDNLYTPLVFANSVLQGDPQNSFASMWRFLLNTTYGIGGLFDFASEAGLKTRSADFGQTLAIYGAQPGAYVVLPVIGPCNVRDTAGRIADAFMNPFNYLGNTTSAVMWSATAIDTRSRNAKLIDDIYETSLDPYSTFRSAFTQKRASDIRRAKAAREKALERIGAK